MVTNQRDKGCICTYYGVENDLRRDRDINCPWHGERKVIHSQEFIIPKNTSIHRARTGPREGLHRGTSLVLVWEQFVTTRAVKYKATDLVHIERIDADDIFWRFTFNLPKQAFPYERIKVDGRFLGIST